MNAERTVVFADLTGSTGVFELLGNVEAAEVVTRLTQWMGEVCGEHDGRVIKFLGDGALMVFETAGDAVATAVALQRGHQDRLLHWPPELRMHLKIGVASGSLAEVGGDCYGEAVNLAARLSDLAGESQIWATEAVLRDETVPDDVQGRDLGPVRVRGLTEARRLIQIDWDDRQDTDRLTMQMEEDPSLEAEGVDDAYIELAHGDQHLVYPVRRMPIHLGRSLQADLVVSNACVSRKHASISWVDSAFVLADLSSYGTWIRFAGSGTELRLRRRSCLLHSSGEIALGASFGDPDAVIIRFQVTTDVLATA